MRVLLLAAGAFGADSVIGVGSASAAIPAGNLILNPGAEDGPGATDTSTSPPPSWTAGGELTAVQYGSPNGFPDLAVRDAVGGGTNFFAGGNGSGSVGDQSIDVTAAAPEIDANDAYATLSGYLGGFSGQGDNATVLAIYQGQDGSTFQQVLFIGPVTAEDRQSQTTLLFRTADGVIPVGTRMIHVTLVASGGDGAYNDAYADNLSLTLHQGKPPPPPPPPPTMGETANAAPDRGTVRVKLPGSGGFIDLEDAKQLPVGTEFDTTNGTVRLNTAEAGGQTGEGTFSGGRFVLGQTKKSALTTLSMRGGGLTGCKTKAPKGGAAKRGEATAAAKRRRTLFSNVKGHFRTRGRNSSATVRGTQWRMTDTCSGTLTQVKAGSVTVRDFRLKKNKVVTAGHSYFARSAKKKRKRSLG